VSWRWERDSQAQFGSIGDEHHPLAHLRHPIECGIQERVSGDVSILFENLADVLRDVLAAMIEDVRDILDKQRQWLESADIAKILKIELRPRVAPKSLRVICNLTKLGPANPGKRLTRRAADKDIERQTGRAQAKGRSEPLRRKVKDISRFATSRVVRMKIGTVGRCSLRIHLYRRGNIKSRPLKSERQPTTPCEQVQHPRRRPVRQTRYFPGDLRLCAWEPHYR
jgi:hypothetical protein